MSSNIRDQVQERYAGIAREALEKQRASCCDDNGDSVCCTRADTIPANALTALRDDAALPDEIIETSLGCGTPLELAALQAGEVVLDLGSGGGLDCFYAAKLVGARGHVIGVDMTPEMIGRAQSSAKRLNIQNVEFRQGYLEDLPVESNTVDVIISNCVINLAPEKSKVFAEAFRVLKPGGKFAVSDIVTDGPLPEAIKKSLSAWAGCVAGALEAKDYLAMMEAVGFKNIYVTPVFFDKETIDSAIADMGNAIELKTIPRDNLYKAVYSAKITAYKAQQ